MTIYEILYFSPGPAEEMLLDCVASNSCHPSSIVVQENRSFAITAIEVSHLQPAIMAITTKLTEQLNIKHPIMLAGMGMTSGAPLAAAVSNAGGLGVIGGVGYTNDMLKEMISELKSSLKDPSLPFGVDLLIPQVGGSARKTNVDYNKGNLDQLIETIIEGGAKVFVSAVGVAPKNVVDRLHDAGVLYMNMVYVPRSLEPTVLAY